MVNAVLGFPSGLDYQVLDEAMRHTELLAMQCRRLMVEVDGIKGNNALGDSDLNTISQSIRMRASDAEMVEQVSSSVMRHQPLSFNLTFVRDS